MSASRLLVSDPLSQPDCGETARATASKICTYPVQRQRFPESPSRISSSVGRGVLSKRCTAARIMPGVQMPHSRRPTLKESLLQPVQSAVGGQPFNGDNACAACLQRRHEAAIHELAVQEHGARAAFALATAFLGPGEMKLFPQHIKQPRHGICAHCLGGAVHGEGDFLFFRGGGGRIQSDARGGVRVQPTGINRG